MLLDKLIILQILNILTAKTVKNQSSLKKTNYKTLQTGTFYLNSERPLWILQDQKDKQVQVKNSLKESMAHENIKAFNNYNRQQQHQQQQRHLTHYGQRSFKTKAQKRISHKGIPLPHNYIPVKKVNKSNSKTSSRRYQNSRFIEKMPIFDAIPGDEAFSTSRPIFIYTGNKGRMLLNTMLSKHKYPMQEPVPGQVLYPPQALVFKPKPLVENLQRKFNVTMIPFYAYEAIDPKSKSKVLQTTSTTTATTQFDEPKNQKKAKQYAAYFSPEAVLSQPVADHSHYSHYIEHTTNSPRILEKPYANHRLDNTPLSTTTAMPRKKFEVIYNDGEDKFQITYEDDGAHLERPLNIQTTKSTSTQSPLPYESYTFDNNYYAFPVYTMAKLMENEDSAQGPKVTKADEDASVERQRMEKYLDAALKEENDSLSHKSNEDTWFILNTKYKGPLKTNGNNLHSSKYIQTSLSKSQDGASKTSLQPHLHSLYGENLNFV